MDAERMRAFLLALPHVAETMQWGNNLVFWVGDKAIGGKMFALMNLDEPGAGPAQILCYAAGPERYGELLEVEGLSPAPYFARAHWVAVEHWEVFRTKEWEDQIRGAYAVIFAKLSKSTRAILEMPATEQRRIVKERRALLSREKLAAAKKAGPKTADSKKA